MSLNLRGPAAGTYVRPGSVGDRLRKAAAAAFRTNSIELGVMATPPTITTGTANLDATLTNSYRVSVAGLTPYRITGGAPMLGAGIYNVYAQAPAVSTPNGTGGNTPGSSSKQQYGWSVEFMTDAPKVMLRYLNGSLTYMLEVDDQPVSATGLTFPSTTGTGYTLLDFGGVSKVRKIRVEYQQASGFDGVYVGPTYRAWAPVSDTNLRVVTVGDSIDAATGATLANGSWQKVCGKLLGWTDVRQVSFGGTGFSTAGSWNTLGSALRVSDAASHAPDLLIIQASQNDDGKGTLQADALAAFQAYRAALPNVPIVVLGAHAASSGPSAARVANEAAVKAAFQQWGDARSWFIPITASTTDSWESGTGTTAAPTGTGNRDRYGNDTAHPNDLGHAYYGQRVANALRTQVLSAIA